MKTAVVLMNLGGPDSPTAVKPFLFNLFNDRFIFTVPQPFRSLLAWLVSTRRAPVARAIYAHIGGKSPILEETLAQAEALEKRLITSGPARVFVAMRHWHPFTRETLDKVMEYGPDKVILLPLYPHYSRSTTQSAFEAWYAQAKKKNFQAPHHPVCCYPFDNHFIDAHIALLRPALVQAAQHGTLRILFSAHGLPQKSVDNGDPYQWQIERNVAAILRKLGEPVDSVICYQSRVGPLQWLTPYTTDEIARAGQDNKAIVIVPIAFVSEHSETLVELDIEYRKLAKEHRVPHYERVPALSVQPDFIESLAWLVEATKLYPNCSNSLGRICPKAFGHCGFREWGAPA